jgi:integrase
MTKGEALEAPARSGEVKQRVLTVDEVGQLLLELEWGAHDIAARFMLLTGARCSEVCDATWDEIDLCKEVWTIPGDRSKDTRRARSSADHVVPLPRQATTLLRHVRPGEGRLVFTGERGARSGFCADQCGDCVEQL